MHDRIALPPAHAPMPAKVKRDHNRGRHKHRSPRKPRNNKDSSHSHDSNTSSTSSASGVSTADYTSLSTQERTKFVDHSKKSDRREKMDASSNQAPSTVDHDTRENDQPAPAWLSDTHVVNDTNTPLAERLGTEILAYEKYTKEVIERVQQPIDAAIAHLSTAAKALWPQAYVRPFGSYASGLWLPSSDVDVVVMGIASDPNTGRSSDISALQHLASSLQAQPYVEHVEVITSAKVPVAKLVLSEDGHHHQRMDVTIETLHTHHGLAASDLVRQYVDNIPSLHPLAIILKQFLREKGLNDAFTGGLSSYTVTLLCVMLIEKLGQAHATAPKEIGQLLLDFLEYYGLTFNYAQTGISLRPELFGEYFLAPSHVTGLMPQLIVDDPVYQNGQHNTAAGAFAIARVISALENGFYAVSFHRPSKFTRTPLCQLLHWSGHQIQ